VSCVFLPREKRTSPTDLMMQTDLSVRLLLCTTYMTSSQIPKNRKDLNTRGSISYFPPHVNTEQSQRAPSTPLPLPLDPLEETFSVVNEIS